MNYFIRKAQKVIENPRRAFRYIYNSLWRKIQVGTWFSLRETCSFSVGEHTVSFQTKDFYSREWFFPRCDQGRYHEPAVTKLMLILAPRATSFIDVGAHLGYFTVLMGAAMRGKKVLAYEMDDRAFSILSKNIELNGLSNVSLRHEAVAAVTGTTQYRRPANL